jgi:two-component system NarL family sensor kinase
MMWIDAIALTGLGVIALCALVLNVSESRSADVKLKRLAQQVVESQEKERARLSRELHDGISQMMVSVKLLLESALMRFERGEARVPAAEAALSTSLARLSDTLREVRRISHALRPAMLDDLGLAAALQQLTRELSEQAGIEIGFTQIAHTHATLLPDAVNTVVFRIAQEALTNIVRHAQASRASVSLDVSSNAVTLSIADNGRGFDVERALADPRAGVGLRNMRERVDSLGGSLTLASQPGHTNVTAHVPVGARSSGSDIL